MLFPQPNPHPVRRVPLFARRLPVAVQHAFDVFFDRSQSRWFRIVFFRSGGAALAIAWRTIRR
jgi:hypothetical protein